MRRKLTRYVYFSQSNWLTWRAGVMTLLLHSDIIIYLKTPTHFLCTFISAGKNTPRFNIDHWHAQYGTELCSIPDTDKHTQIHTQIQAEKLQMFVFYLDSGALLLFTFMTIKQSGLWIIKRQIFETENGQRGYIEWMLMFRFLKPHTHSSWTMMILNITYIVWQLEPSHVCYVLPQCQTTVHLDIQNGNLKLGKVLTSLPLHLHVLQGCASI